MSATDESPQTDKAGATLWTARALASLFVVSAVAWAFQAPSRLGISMFKEQFLLIALGLAGAALFLTVSRDGGKSGKAPWYDCVAAVLFLGAPLYIAQDYQRFLTDAPYDTTEMLVLSVLLIFLIMEGLRRVAGMFLFIVVVVFFVYALFAHLVPAPLTGTRSAPTALAIYLAFDTNSLLGSPLTVATTTVVLFILLGQVLFNTGGGEFFTDIASATMGKRRGGAAKVSVIASGLFGSISGSAISNVTTTGVITIPLMRKSGYSATDAGAIEANASTGGQFMPPIMGAAAFLMAEFLEMPYSQVVAAALIPALLYYFAIFIQVDLVAARDRISVVTDELPSSMKVLREGWHFIVPFALLIYALYALSAEAEIAALYAVAAIIVFGFLRSYQGRRMRLRTLASSIWDAGLATTELVLIVAAAGFVIGILNKSGGGFALTLFLIQLGGGNIFVLLLIAGIICIVLGMGMPTTGVYVLLAALVAPALVEAGISKLSAHMFILYFGMMSMITPPIALAAFAAASLSRADPMKTGFVAMRMGWVAYVIPFLFALSPTLLMQGDPWKITINVISATVGVFLGSVAVTGFFTRPMSMPLRILLALAGLAAVFPDSAIGAGGLIDLAGVVTGGAILMREYLAVHRRNPTSKSNPA